MIFINKDEAPDIAGLDFPLPPGDNAVGWGFLEYYTDQKKWFRMAVREYNPNKHEPYLVSVG